MYEEMQKQYKNWVDAVEAIVKGNEFWVNHFLSSLKTLYKK